MKKKVSFSRILLTGFFIICFFVNIVGASSWTVYPIDDGGLVGSTSTNPPGVDPWSVLDEGGVGDGDSTYLSVNSDSYVTNTFELDGFSGSPTISNVTVYARIRPNDGVGPVSGYLVIRDNISGDVSFSGLKYASGAGYSLVSNTFTSNPGGGSWTLINLNNLEIGISLKNGLSTNPRCTQVYGVVGYSGDMTNSSVISMYNVSNVANSSATLNGIIANPNVTSWVGFWVGTDPSVTEATKQFNISSGSSNISVFFSNDITNLIPLTTYYVRCWRNNSWGFNVSSNTLNFTTLNYRLNGSYNNSLYNDGDYLYLDMEDGDLPTFNSSRANHSINTDAKLTRNNSLNVKYLYNYSVANGILLEQYFFDTPIKPNRWSCKMLIDSSTNDTMTQMAVRDGNSDIVGSLRFYKSGFEIKAATVINYMTVLYTFDMTWSYDTVYSIIFSNIDYTVETLDVSVSDGATVETISGIPFANYTFGNKYIKQFILSGGTSARSEVYVDMWTMGHSVKMQNPVVSNVEEASALVSCIVGNDGSPFQEGVENNHTYNFSYDNSSYDITGPASSYLYNYTFGKNNYTDDVLSYSLSGLSPGSCYFYRFFGNTSYINSSSYCWTPEGCFLTKPLPPTNPGTTLLNSSCVRINWTKGSGAKNTVVVMSNSGYPTSITDGTVIYNGTGTSYDYGSLITGTYYYFSLWSYSSYLDLYQYSDTNIDLSFGGLYINCYDEDTNNNLTFDVFISNQDGSETYISYNNTNSLIINAGDYPTGNNINIQISSSSNYNDKNETFTGYALDQNESTTYVILLVPPKSKSFTNVTCMNTVSGTNSYPSFTLLDDVITIVPDAANVFNKIVVNYTYEEYKTRTYVYTLNDNMFYFINAYLPPSDLSLIYTINVVGVQGEFTSPPIEDASIEVKRYLDGSYIPISVKKTDANGQMQIYLMPGEDYLLNISKSGYNDEYATLTPIDSSNPADRVYTFRLTPTSIVPGAEDEIFREVITFYGVMVDSGYLKLGNITVTYIDSNSTTLDTQIYLYEMYNGTNTLLNTASNISEQSIQYTVGSINTSRTHYLLLYFNNSNSFDTTPPVVYTMLLLHPIRGDNTSDLDERITNVIGPFKTDDMSMAISWADIIGISIPIIVLAAICIFDVTAGLVACGLSFGLVQGLYAAVGFTNTINPLLVTLAPVIIVIGILHYLAVREPREVL